MKRVLTAVGALTVLSPCVAAAAVSTTCAGTSSCTLAELSGGGTITVDDVTFGLANYDDYGLVPVDGSAVVVTGASAAGLAALDFVASPALSIAGDTFLALAFDIFASVAPSSSATIAAATLSTTGDGITIGGTASGRVAMAVGAGFPEIYDDFELGEVLSATQPLGGLTMVTALSTIALDGFASDAEAGLTAFRYALSVEGGTSAEIPLPAALPLFLGGLGLLAGRRVLSPSRND